MIWSGLNCARPPGITLLARRATPPLRRSALCPRGYRLAENSKLSLKTVRVPFYFESSQIQPLKRNLNISIFQLNLTRYRFVPKYNFLVSSVFKIQNFSPLFHPDGLLINQTESYYISTGWFMSLNSVRAKCISFSISLVNLKYLKRFCATQENLMWCSSTQLSPTLCFAVFPVPGLSGPSPLRMGFYTNCWCEYRIFSDAVHCVCAKCTWFLIILFNLKYLKRFGATQENLTWCSCIQLLPPLCFAVFLASGLSGLSPLRMDFYTNSAGTSTAYSLQFIGDDAGGVFRFSRSHAARLYDLLLPFARE